MVKTFEDVVAGRTPVQRVFEDEAHLAFLAPSPLTRGHTVVVTKRTAPYLFELTEAEHAALWAAVRHVARLLEEKLACERVCVAVVGWEVRHVHVHLVPTRRSGEFPPLPGTPADERELADLAAELRGPR